MYDVIDDNTCWYDSIGQYKPKNVPSTLTKTILGAVFEFKALGNPLFKAFSNPKLWDLWGGSIHQPIWKIFLQACC